MKNSTKTTPGGKGTNEKGAVTDENRTNEGIQDVGGQKRNEGPKDMYNAKPQGGRKDPVIETEYVKEREPEYVPLLVTVKKTVSEDEDKWDVQKEIVDHVVWIVVRWIERGDVEGVRGVQGERLTTKVEDNLNLWLSEPKTSGKHTVKVELYFTVETKLGVRELVDLDRVEYKRDNVWIEQKNTLNEHTSRIGYLTGPIVENVNLNEYDKMMTTLGEGEKGQIEVKRNMVYEGQEKEWCVTVYSVRSAAERMDFELRKMSAEKKSHIKYVSFKNSTKADKIAGLKLNRLLNVPLRYEWLSDVKVLQQAKYRGQKGSLGKMIMDVKVKGITLFNGVEQGKGKNSSRVYLYYKPNMIDEVHQWIRTTYGKDFVVEGKGAYESSVKAINPKEEKYNSDIRDYIVDRIKEIQIEEESYSSDKRSYSEVVRGISKEKSTKSYTNEAEDDDDTIVTDNRSRDSEISDDTMTEVSRETMQTKVILDMQGMMKRMQEDHDKMMQHIRFMEDTVISLTDENGSREKYEKAQKTADKLRKKRKIEEREVSKRKTEIDNQKLRRSMRLNKKTEQKEKNISEEENKSLEQNEREKGDKVAEDQGMDIEDNPNDNQREE